MSITLPWLRPAKHDPDTIIPAPRDLTGGVLPLRDALQPTPVTNPGQTAWGARNEQQAVS